MVLAKRHRGRTWHLGCLPADDRQPRRYNGDVFIGTGRPCCRLDDDPSRFVANALSPAKVVSVSVIDEAGRAARVVVPDFQLSLAIGKEGQNARLAARLTGWRIDIRSDAAPEPDGSAAPGAHQGAARER